MTARLQHVCQLSALTSRITVICKPLPIWLSHCLHAGCLSSGDLQLPWRRWPLKLLPIRCRMQKKLNAIISFSYSQGGPSLVFYSRVTEPLMNQKESAKKKTTSKKTSNFIYIFYACFINLSSHCAVERKF